MISQLPFFKSPENVSLDYGIYTTNLTAWEILQVIPPAKITAMLILIVDHDANDVHLFFEAIKSLDFSAQCIAAYNGPQALEIVNSGVTPALIFLDASMEGMTAIKTIKALRKDRRCKDIPMVIFGSIDQKARIGATRITNNIHYMARPLEHSDLPLAVKDFLTLHTGT